MPEIHNPSPRQDSGPGAALSNAAVRRRRRRGSFAIKKKVAAATSPSSMRFEIDAAMEPLAVVNTVTPAASRRTSTLKLQLTTSISSRPKQRKRVGNRVCSPKSTPNPSTLPNMPCQNQGIGSGLPLSGGQTKPQEYQQAQPFTHVRHALLVDSRTIDTNAGRVIGESVLESTRSFLSSLRCRGMAPYLLSGLTLHSTTTPRARPQISCQTLRVLGNARLTVSVDCFCQSLLIQPALNSGNLMNTQAIKVPTRLLANASWKILGDLVEEATTQDAKSPASARKVPLSITIVTSDMALLCDSDIDAHEAAFTKFWNCVRTFFHKNLCKSIDIVLLDTGSVRMEEANSTAPNLETNTDAQDKAKLVTEQSQEQKPCTEGTQAEAMDTTISQQETPIGETSVAGEAETLSRVARFVKCIRENIADLADADYKVDRSREVAVNPISLSLTLIENNHRDLNALGRRWMSLLMTPTTGSVTFELPETMDGTQCSISLDVKYRLMPYPADSHFATGMLADLQVLASSQVEVVQLVPVSCIDANLIFGVPMEVLPGFQNDEDRFQEMQALVHLLLKQLRDRDAALLLRATNDANNSDFGPPLHHRHHQTYLLMAQDFSDASIIPTSRSPMPFEASLFRYGNADQMMSVDSAGLYTPQVDEETLKQLHDYVSSSLDMMQVGVINPLVNEEARVLKEFERLTMSTKDEEMTEEVDEWNDHIGVGSREFQSKEDSKHTNGDGQYQRQRDVLPTKTTKPKEPVEDSGSNRIKAIRKTKPRRKTSKKIKLTQQGVQEEEMSQSVSSKSLVDPDSPSNEEGIETSGAQLVVEDEDAKDVTGLSRPKSGKPLVDTGSLPTEEGIETSGAPLIVKEEDAKDVKGPKTCESGKENLDTKSVNTKTLGQSHESSTGGGKKHGTKNNFGSSQSSLEDIDEAPGDESIDNHGMVHATRKEASDSKRHRKSDDSNNDWKSHHGKSKSSELLKPDAVAPQAKAVEAIVGDSSDEELFQRMESRARFSTNDGTKRQLSIQESETWDDSSDMSDELLHAIQKARRTKRIKATQVLEDTDTESE